MGSQILGFPQKIIQQTHKLQWGMGWSRFEAKGNGLARHVFFNPSQIGIFCLPRIWYLGFVHQKQWSLVSTLLGEIQIPLHLRVNICFVMCSSVLERVGEKNYSCARLAIRAHLMQLCIWGFQVLDVFQRYYLGWKTFPKSEDFIFNH